MVNFNTTTQSTKYVASLLASEDTSFIMDGLLSAKQPDRQEESNMYFRRSPPPFIDDSYNDDVFTIVNKFLLENEVLFQIESVTTKEKYFISKSLFELNYKGI